MEVQEVVSEPAAAPKKRGKKKGSPKTGGKQKGYLSPKKMFQFKTVRDLLEEHGCPANELFKIAKATKDIALKVRIYSELVPYVYPKLQAIKVDVSTSDNLKRYGNFDPMELFQQAIAASNVIEAEVTEDDQQDQERESQD